MHKFSKELIEERINILINEWDFLQRENILIIAMEKF